MGLKGVHAFGREGAYHQIDSVPGYLQQNDVNIVFVDFCCVFFFLLQQGRLPGAAPAGQQHFPDQGLNNLSIAERLFAHSIAHEYGDEYAAFRETVHGFVDLTIDQLGQLSVASGGPDICVVIDGQERLPAKRVTHKARKKRQHNAFRVARRIFTRQGHHYIFRRHFSFAKQVKRWVSFTHAIKESMLNYLQSENSPAVPYIQRVQQNAPPGTHLYYQYAPFEADSEVVYLCQNLAANDNGAILSRDGDLFAYGGALDVPRILKIDWNDPNLGGVVTTKTELLQQLEFPMETQIQQTQSQVRFAVLAATCGNDYAENVRYKSFRTVSRIIQNIGPFAGSANELLQIVVDNLGLVMDFQAFRFTVALHQFCEPVVSGTAHLQAQHQLQAIPIEQVVQGQELFDLQFNLGIAEHPGVLADDPPHENQDVPHANRYDNRFKTITAPGQVFEQALFNSTAPENHAINPYIDEGSSVSVFSDEAITEDDTDDGDHSDQPPSPGPRQSSSKGKGKATAGPSSSKAGPSQSSSKGKGKAPAKPYSSEASSSKLSSSKKKKTKHKGQGPAEQEEYPTQITVPPDPTIGGGRDIVHQKSRRVRTLQAGLFSSLVAAAYRRPGTEPVEAVYEAKLLHGVLNTIVDKISYARFVCLHIVQIATRIAHDHLDQETAAGFYTLFFDNSSQNWWRFLMNCAMDYQPGTRQRATAAQINAANQEPYRADEMQQLLQQNGDLREGTTVYYLKAYPEDQAFIHLVSAGRTMPQARNIVLVARKLWYLECSPQMRQPMSSLYTSDLVTQLLPDLDRAFRANIVVNFQQRFCKYLECRLKQEAEFPLGWPNDDTFIAQIVNAVNAQDVELVVLPGIAQDLLETIREFVQGIINKRNGAGTIPADGNIIVPYHAADCRLDLIRKATKPAGWPGAKDRLIEYLFRHIWSAPLRSHEDAEDDREQEDDPLFINQLHNAPDDVRQEIQNFIDAEIDLVRITCNLGDDVVNLRRYINAIPLLRAEDNNPEEDIVAPPSYLQADEYDGDVEVGDPETGDLLLVMLDMLDRCQTVGLSFAVSPLAAMHKIPIPFSLSFIAVVQHHFAHFSDPVIAQIPARNRHHYNQAQGRILHHLADGTWLFGHLHPDDFEEDEERRFASPVEGQDALPQDTGDFSRLFDIRWKGTVTYENQEYEEDGVVASEPVPVGLNMKKRCGYSRLLHKRLPRDPAQRRFTSRRIFMTDGVRLFQLFNDWQDRGGRVTPKYLTELRRTTRETLNGGGHNEDVNLFEGFAGAFGLDFGERYTVASVFQPQDPLLDGSQVLIKRGSLYGRTIPNQHALERRKDRRGIHEREAALSQGSTCGTFQQYIDYLAAFKNNNLNMELWNFYSDPWVLRVRWDNTMSIKSCMDKACYLLMEQGRRCLQAQGNGGGPGGQSPDQNPYQGSVPGTSSGDISMQSASTPQSSDTSMAQAGSSSGGVASVMSLDPGSPSGQSNISSISVEIEVEQALRYIWGFGMDGLSKKSRKGAMAPVDHKFARTLFHKILSLRPQDVMTRVDEYMSSRKCAWCVKHGMDHFVNYFQRPARYPVHDRTRIVRQEQDQNIIEIIRLVHCNGDGGCGRILHRDGNAASNLATITKCMLQYRQRPACFIRPSRQLIQEEN